MNCPFCNTSIPSEIEADIHQVAFYCPSACDMSAKLEAICPHCDRVFWSQWVEVSYLWEWEPRALFAAHLPEDEFSQWSKPMLAERGVAEWELIEGKLHYYLDIAELEGVFEIVER